MRVYRVLRVLGFICFLTLNFAAQNGYSISGTVNDSGRPIKGAVVTLTPDGETVPKYTKETNAEGFYGFYAAPGKYTLKAIKKQDNIVGSSAVSIVEIRFGNPETVNIKLSETAAIRETVTISADAEQPLDEVSKSVNIIDAQEMRDRADFSLAETLKTIPGFRVQQLGGFGRTASIKTRGLRNQDTAILIDGIRFRDASSITGDASAFLSDFTLTSVNKIEVLRGAGSSLYGTNAIGGTVDFQTPKPKPGFHGQVSGAFGGLGLGRFRGNISDGTDDGKFNFNLAVSRTAYTKGIDGEDDAHNTNFQNRIEYNPWSKTNISARFFVSDAYVRLNSNPDTLGDPPISNSSIVNAEQGVNFIFDVNDPDNFQKSRFFNGQVVLTQVITDDLVFQGYYSGLKTSRKNDNGLLGVPFQSASTSFFDGTIQTANGHFNWTPNSTNTITAGYEFEHEKYGNDGFTPDGLGNFLTRGFQSSNTIYVQDLLSLVNGRLQIAGGFRAQFFNLKSPDFSLTNAPYTNLTLENPPAAYTFDGSASYYFQKPGTKLRFHAGNGYRVPSLYERFGTFFSTFGKAEFVALGDPNLKPEKTFAFDGGLEQNILGGKGKVTAVYFYSNLIDAIGFGNEAPSIGDTIRPFGGYVNTKGGTARGLELSGDFRPSGTTDIFASYTFTNSGQRDTQVSGSGIFRTLGIPRHQFTLVATQRFKRFWVNFDFAASSGYLAPIFSSTNFETLVYRFEGNRKADLTAGYTFPLNADKFNLRIFGTIENLFDYEYYENGFRTAGINGRVGLSFGF
ncbi:MAG: TonB-dependent receptor [Blastocatellia bacterium]|nr:TonB-dependent receptor [Blastocatellia bacterium]